MGRAKVTLPGSLYSAETLCFPPATSCALRVSFTKFSLGCRNLVCGPASVRCGKQGKIAGSKRQRSAWRGGKPGGTPLSLSWRHVPNPGYFESCSIISPGRVCRPADKTGEVVLPLATKPLPFSNNRWPRQAQGFTELRLFCQLDGASHASCG